MRRKFRLSIKATIGFMFALSALGDSNMLERRGFQPKFCYRHLAVRECKLLPKFHCGLEIFPYTSGEIYFELDPRTDALIANEETTDYGIFDFQLGSGEDNLKITKILAIQRVPLKDFHRSGDRDGLARSITCPNRPR